MSYKEHYIGAPNTDFLDEEEEKGQWPLPFKAVDINMPIQQFRLKSKLTNKHIVVYVTPEYVELVVDGVLKSKIII